MADVEPVPGVPGYAVSSDGILFSLYYKGCHGKMGDEWVHLPGFTDRYGYKKAALVGVGHVYVHRLVLAAFRGVPFRERNGMHVRHLDGDPENNSLANLAYGTAAENVADTISQGRLRCGEDTKASKLTDDDVREIRSLASSGMTQAAIADRFNIHRSNVSYIVRGKTWAHLLEV